MKSIKKKNCRYNSQITWMLSLWKKCFLWEGRKYILSPIPFLIFEFWHFSFSLSIHHPTQKSPLSSLYLRYLKYIKALSQMLLRLSLFSKSKKLQPLKRALYIFLFFFSSYTLLCLSIYCSYKERERREREGGRERLDIVVL